LPIDGSAEFEIDLQGDFQFEATPESTAHDSETSDQFSAGTDEKAEPSAPLFTLKDIHLQIPRGKCIRSWRRKLIAGALVCIVGRVGVGKSALLLGMIKEMRQTSGHMRLGGSVSYGKPNSAAIAHGVVPQEAWVQSGSISDNITFSSAKSDLVRIAEVIQACGL
jgi:ABC-type transport system involved in cytochrome bd biosynthesis fused ATPase/permease subunit